MAKYPADWKTWLVKDFATKVAREVDVKPDSLYRQIGIRSHGKGIFHKEPIKGVGLGNKRVFWVEAGDFVVNIVFAWEGAVAVVSEKENGMCASHRFPTFVLDKNICIPEYLLLYFKTKRGLEQLGLASPGGAGRNRTLGQSNFLDLQIILPSIKEQRIISSISGLWDASITVADQIVSTLRERKMGIAQKMLLPSMETGEPEIRFAGFSEPWRFERLDNIFTRVNRKNSVGNTNILTASGEHGLLSQTEYFKRTVAGEGIESYYLLHRGEFAYNRSSSEGYPYGAIKQLVDYDTGILSTLYLCFRLLDETADAAFYRHFFEAGGINRGIYSIAQEGARNHGLLNVSVADFFGLRVPVPQPAEQRLLAQFYDTIDEEIECAIQHAEHLRQQKRGLMQRLLTGQVRINVDT